MSSRLLPAIRSTVRQLLKDEFLEGVAQDFENDEIDIHIGEAKAEISERSPVVVKEVLTTIANSKVLDISSIEDLLEIEKAEYPIGEEPRKFRNVEYLDNETIEIDTTLTPSAGGSGTITGTVTFATGNATVTGSGTSFLDDLEANYLIRKSGGTRWYRIYSIESDTSLTLDEPVRSSDTGADTVDLTEYCYEAVYLYCRKLHELTEESSTLTPQLERVLIDGTVAKVALSWINLVRVQVKEAIAKIAGIDSAVGGMTARLTQAISDLAAGRELGFNKVYTGGRPLDDYANYSARELSASISSLNQAGGHLRELSARLSISGVINSYQTWANNKLALYRVDLGRLSQARTYKEYPKS